MRSRCFARRRQAARTEILLKLDQLVPQIERSLVALRRILGKTVADDPPEIAGNAPADIGRERRRVLENRRKQQRACLALERALASRQLVEDDAE